MLHPIGHGIADNANSTSPLQFERGCVSDARGNQRGNYEDVTIHRFGPFGTRWRFGMRESSYFRKEHRLGTTEFKNHRLSFDRELE
jgi:hypothetical protein